KEHRTRQAPQDGHEQRQHNDEHFGHNEQFYVQPERSKDVGKRLLEPLGVEEGLPDSKPPRRVDHRHDHDGEEHHGADQGDPDAARSPPSAAAAQDARTTVALSRRHRLSRRACYCEMTGKVMSFKYFCLSMSSVPFEVSVPMALFTHPTSELPFSNTRP